MPTAYPKQEELKRGSCPNVPGTSDVSCGPGTGEADLALFARCGGRRTAGPRSIKIRRIGSPDEPNYLLADNYWVAFSGTKWRGPENWMSRAAFFAHFIRSPQHNSPPGGTAANILSRQ
eukprot:2411948-Amphidinium_carterae.1